MDTQPRLFAYVLSTAVSELGQQVKQLWQRPDGLQTLKYLWPWPFQKMFANPCFRSLLPPEQNYYKNLDGNILSILLKLSRRNELYCRRYNCSWCVCVSILLLTHTSLVHPQNTEQSNNNQIEFPLVFCQNFQTYKNNRFKHIFSVLLLRRNICQNRRIEYIMFNSLLAWFITFEMFRCMGCGVSMSSFVQGPVKGGSEEDVPGLGEEITEKWKADRQGFGSKHAWGPPGTGLSKGSSSQGPGGSPMAEMSQMCCHYISVMEQEGISLLSAQGNKTP